MVFFGRRVVGEGWSGGKEDHSHIRDTHRDFVFFARVHE